MPAKATCTWSPGSIGNCRVNEPLMMISPGWIERPNSASLRASHTTEFSGLPSTASPTSGRDGAAVDLHRRLYGLQCTIAELHGVSKDHGLLLRIVRHRKCDLCREVAAG